MKTKNKTWNYTKKVVDEYIKNSLCPNKLNAKKVEIIAEVSFSTLLVII